MRGRTGGKHNSLTPQARYNTLECPKPWTGQHIEEPYPLQHPVRASPRQASALWHLHLPPASVRDHLQGGEPSERDKSTCGLRPCFPAKKMKKRNGKGGKMICIIYALLLFKTQLLFLKRLQYNTAQGNWNTRIAFFNTILTISQTA